MTLDTLAAEMRDAEAVLLAKHQAGELTDAEYQEQALRSAKSYGRRMRMALEQEHIMPALQAAAIAKPSQSWLGRIFRRR